MHDYSKYLIDHSATVLDALAKLDSLSSDVLTLFVMDGEKLVGTLTDGDIRRMLVKGVPLTENVTEIMNRNFSYLHPNEKNVEKIRAIRARGIQLLPSIDEKGNLVNIYNLKKKKSILPVDAVLMAGGKGERLRPLTDNTPKPLLTIGDKAIIDYNIDNLIRYGIENIHVTTNYLSEQIDRHFEQERQGVKVSCIREKEYLGTIASVKIIPGIDNDEIIVMNSDLFTDIDFEDFYRHFMQHDADMSVAAVPYSVSVPFGIFDLEGRHIKGIKEKPKFNYYANAGIYLIKKNVLDLIPRDVFFDATDLIDLLVNLGKKVVRYPLGGYWIDIGNMDDYRRAQDFVRHLK